MGDAPLKRRSPRVSIKTNRLADHQEQPPATVRAIKRDISYMLTKALMSGTGYGVSAVTPLKLNILQYAGVATDNKAKINKAILKAAKRKEKRLQVKKRRVIFSDDPIYDSDEIEYEYEMYGDSAKHAMRSLLKHEQVQAEAQTFRDKVRKQLAEYNRERERRLQAMGPAQRFMIEEIQRSATPTIAGAGPAGSGIPAVWL